LLGLKDYALGKAKGKAKGKGKAKAML